MGILTSNKSKIATHLQQLPSRTRSSGDGEQFALSVVPAGAPAARHDPRELLPPPDPCQTCGMAIRWLSIYGDRWRCPTCEPPAVRHLIAAKVILVDVDGAAVSPQWWKLTQVEKFDRGSRETKIERMVFPIECEANGNLDGAANDTTLVDGVACGGAAMASGATASRAGQFGQSDKIIRNGGFSIDERLGPPIGDDGNRLDDDEWFAAGASDVVWNQFFENRG